MNSTARLTVFADYGQFYLLDSEVLPEYPERVEDQHLEDRFQLAPGLIAVYPTETQQVEVEIETVDSEPVIDPETWQHIIQCSIETPSGSLVLASCSDYLPDCPRVPTFKGQCGVIILGKNLGQSSGESYRFYIWPANAPITKIIKRYGATA